MGQYRRDFSAGSTLTGLTRVGSSASGTYAVSGTGSSAVMRYTNSSNVLTQDSFLVLDEVPDSTDVNILTKWRAYAEANNGLVKNVAGGRLNRAGGTTLTGYTVTRYPCSIPGYGNPYNYMALAKWVSGTRTQYNTYGVSGPTPWLTQIDNNTWFYTRFQITGTTIREKTWRVGAPEPTTWELSYTDSSVSTAGAVGFGGSGGLSGGFNPIVEWQLFSVGTEGDVPLDVPVVDTVPATITSVSGVPSGSTSLHYFTVSISANESIYSSTDRTPSAGWQYNLDGAGWTDFSAPPTDGSSSATNSFSKLAPGAHSLQFRVYDLGQNVTTSAAYTWTQTVDTVNPIASFAAGQTQPVSEGGKLAAASSGNVSATFFVNSNEPYSKLEYTTDNSSSWTTITTDTGLGVYSSQLISFVGFGAHRARFRATDYAGNLSTELIRNFTVNPTAPTIGTKPDYSLPGGADLSFAASISGFTGQFAYALNNGPFTNVGGATATTASWTLPVGDLQSGTNTVYVQYTTAGGLVSVAGSYSWSHFPYGNPGTTRALALTMSAGQSAWVGPPGGFGDATASYGDLAGLSSTSGAPRYQFWTKFSSPTATSVTVDAIGSTQNTSFYSYLDVYEENPITKGLTRIGGDGSSGGYSGSGYWGLYSFTPKANYTYYVVQNQSSAPNALGKPAIKITNLPARTRLLANVISI